MKLYKSSNRFINEYNFLQSNKAEPLNIFDFSKFDNLHYHGVTAVNFAINKLAINKNDIILDIGSGVGGPARFISYKTGCRVDAIELQSDLSIIGKKFTEILCMSKNVKHINNDFLQKKFRNNYYNHIVCWLSLYHIIDRKEYLRKINKILKEKGGVYIEDFYIRKKISSIVQKKLSNNFFANSLVKKNDFIEGLSSNNFDIIYKKDMTQSWIKFTDKRLKDFIENKKRNLLVHNLNTFKNLLDFYKLANYLLSSGNLGGIRLYCVKK